MDSVDAGSTQPARDLGAVFERRDVFVRLTLFSDYAIRVLMHAASNPDRLVTM